MAEAHASRDDDALKKNTDCVYFLASPLTCKKVCVHVCCSVCSPLSITWFSPLISHSDQTVLLSFLYLGFLPLQTRNRVFLCIFWGARILGFGAQLDCLGLSVSAQSCSSRIMQFLDNFLWCYLVSVGFLAMWPCFGIGKLGFRGRKGRMACCENQLPSRAFSSILEPLRSAFHCFFGSLFLDHGASKSNDEQNWECVCLSVVFKSIHPLCSVALSDSFGFLPMSLESDTLGLGF